MESSWVWVYMGNVDVTPTGPYYPYQEPGDMSGCLPIGYLLDPEGDNDEESGRCFEGGREDLEEEEED